MKEQLAVVTGASSGIGKAYALFLAGKGYNLILIARRNVLLEELTLEITAKFKVETEILAADLSDSIGLNEVLKEIRSKKPDVLVHAAGFGTRGYFVDIPEDVIGKQIFLHNVAATKLAWALLPDLKEKKEGAIIFISSLAAFLTTAEYAVYSATKSYLNMLATGLRDELAGTGIKVQAVCPGLTRTEFMYTEYFKGFDYAAVPDMFWMEPEEVVEESWKRLSYHYKPVMIPGKMNRLFFNTLQFPLLGRLIKALMGRASRKRVAKGLPPAF